MSNFVRSSILISKAGQNEVNFQNERYQHFKEQDIYQKDDKFLQFKSLQEQVTEQIDEQKKVQLQAEFQQKKEELALTEAANAAKHEFVEIDEDFDYFQYWQENKAETESLWRQQDQEDIKKYKEGRAKIIYNKEDTEPEIKLEKQQSHPLFQVAFYNKLKLHPYFLNNCLAEIINEVTYKTQAQGNGRKTSNQREQLKGAY